MRVALPLGWSALGLAGLALAEGLGWLYLGLVRDVDDMVRSTIAQFMGTLPLFIGLGFQLSPRLRSRPISRVGDQMVGAFVALEPACL